MRSTWWFWVVLSGTTLTGVGCSDSEGGGDPTETSSGSTSTTGTTTSIASTGETSGSTSSTSTGSTSTATSTSTSGSTTESGSSGGSSGSTGGSDIGCPDFDTIVSLGSSGELGGAGFGIELVDNLAFVAARAGGLHIVDVSDPTDPTIVGSLPTTDALEVRVEGTLAIVADNNAGTRVIDVSDPTQPSEEDNLAGSAFGLRVVGDRAFVANRGAGLEVLDLSSPTSITSVGITTLSGTKGIDIVGDRAYVVLEPGFAIFDLTDPDAPVELANTDQIVAEWDIVVDGSFAYAIARTVGVAIVDISDDSAPTTVGTVPGTVWGVDVQSDRVFTVGDDQGLHVWDVSDHTSPDEIGGLATLGIAGAVRVRDNLAYVTTALGLEVLELCPAT